MCGTGYFRGGSSLPLNGLCYRLTRKKPFIHIPVNSQLTLHSTKKSTENSVYELGLLAFISIFELLKIKL